MINLKKKKSYIKSKSNFKLGDQLVTYPYVYSKRKLYFDDNMVYHNKIYKYFILGDSIVLLKPSKHKIVEKGESKDKKLYKYYNTVVYNFDIINRNSKYNLYIINLKHRTDRKEFILNNDQYNKFNLNFFNAIKNDVGYVGCYISHLLLIRYAKINKLPYIIIVEDDNIFKDNIDIVTILDTVMANNSWECFNGSPNIISNNIKFENNLYHINGAYSNNFMIYRQSTYDKILNKHNYKLKLPVDVFVSNHFTQSTILFNNKYIASQKSSFSDVNGGDVDYSGIYTNCENMLLNVHV